MSDTTHELTNRAIAEAVGWTEIHEITYWAETYYDTYEVATLAGRQPGGSTDDSLVPDFWHDANAALSLVDGHYFILQQGHDDNDQPIWKAEMALVFVGKGKSPAEAICRAFMAYAAGKGGT